MFAEALKRLRKQHNLRQTELAKALGVAQSTVGSWEVGVREPDFEMVRQIADFFHVPTDALLRSQSDAASTVALDKETIEIIDAVRDNPEMKLLFSVTSSATKEDIIRAVHIIEALKNERDES